MGLNLFGFEISKKKQEDIIPLQNFTTPEEFDGAYTVEGANNHWGNLIFIIFFCNLLS